MTKWQRFFRELICFSVTFFLVLLLSPAERIYESTSYSNFVQKLENQDLDRIGYDEENKFAIIHSIKEDKEYKVALVSTEKFISDVYEYSLQVDNFQYSNIKKVQKISTFSLACIVISAHLFLRFFLNKMFLSIQEKKGEQKNVSKDNSKKDKKEDGVKKEWFSDIFKTTINRFQPKAVEKVDVTFADVIGLERQIDELRDIVSFLKDSKQYDEIGAQLPKGVLLYGQSGVGKTHIARAIAGEANVPFYATSASELQAMYLGESEERIRTIFKEAEDNAPAIIYIDEIDSIATKRYSEYSNRYSASILNQLLVWMALIKKIK